MSTELAPPAEVRTEIVVKAASMPWAYQGPVQNSQATPEQDQANFTTAGAITPLYDPYYLCWLHTVSSALEPNVRAYAVNIEGYGHQFVPVVNLDQRDETDKRIRETLRTEHVAEGLDGRVTEQELAARKSQIEAEMANELPELTAFFDYCSYECSFVELRERTRVDLEVIGYAFWEVLRDHESKPAQVVQVPAVSTRLMPLDREVISFDQVQQIGLTQRTRRMRRRFRRFVQVVMGFNQTYFKEFGDPRTISSRSNRVYASLEALEETEPGVPPATELIYFKIHSPLTPYGVPRWVGAWLCVKGSRAAEEVNYDYLNNKAIPPGILAISGGKLAEGMRSVIEKHIEERIKGLENFNKLLILEADVGANSNPAAGGRVRIEWIPMTQAQQKDALFGEYDAANRQKIGQTFRLSKILRGDSEVINRSVAESSLEHAEQQVFHPERVKIDHIINRTLLAALEIRYWHYKSNSPLAKNPQTITEMMVALVMAGILTINEARIHISDALNLRLPPRTEKWADQPIALSAAGVLAPLDGMAPTKPFGTAPDAGLAGALLPRPATANGATPSLKQLVDHVRSLIGAPASANVTPAERILPAVAEDEPDTTSAEPGEPEVDARAAALRDMIAQIRAEKSDGGEVLHLSVPADVFASWLEKADAAA